MHFNPWIGIGKRSNFVPWTGKRSYTPWVGKRSGEEALIGSAPSTSSLRDLALAYTMRVGKRDGQLSDTEKVSSTCDIDISHVRAGMLNG